MKIAPLVISILLIGGFMLGLTGWYGSLMLNYSMPDSSPFGTDSQNAVSNTSQKIADMMGKMDQNKSVSGGNLQTDAPTNMINNVFDAGWLVLSLPNLFSSLITDMTSVWGVPTWVPGLITAIIGAIILFAIIAFVSGRETE